MIKTYRTRPRTVEAFKWDGMLLLAEEVAPWLLDALNRGPGHPNSIFRHADVLQVWDDVGQILYCHVGAWVVWFPDVEALTVMTDAEFKAAMEEVP